MNKLNLILTGLATLSFCSCQVKIGQVEEAATSVAIDGNWATNCMVDSVDSYIKTVSVQNGVLTVAKFTYANTNYCDQANLKYTLMQSGSMTISGDSTTVSGGKNYEWQLNAIAFIPNSADYVTELNNNSVCGLNSWVQNQASFVFACNVAPEMNLSQLAYNTVHYGVFHIVAAATPNILQFEYICNQVGYANVCPAPADRPNTVGGDVFIKAAN